MISILAKGSSGGQLRQSTYLVGYLKLATGCGIHETKPNSVGKAFNNANGGAFATLMNQKDGIKIWFWSRPDIPGDVNSGNPDPTSWGPPSASWAASTCSPDKYFPPQKVTLVSAAFWVFSKSRETDAKLILGYSFM